MTHKMTNSLHIYSPPRPLAVVPGRDLLAGLWRAFRAWRRQRRDLARLRALPPHILRDMGLHSSHLAGVVRGHDGFSRRHVGDDDPA
ncbi:MAG: DUF1127 domain-containing protein [Rhodobacterales bacterium]|nr:DUF1127 domain-containing protein [Rhodobacterales bacterium]